MFVILSLSKWPNFTLMSIDISLNSRCANIVCFISTFFKKRLKNISLLFKAMPRAMHNYLRFLKYQNGVLLLMDGLEGQNMGMIKKHNKNRNYKDS